MNRLKRDHGNSAAVLQIAKIQRIHLDTPRQALGGIQ